jgi:uncharacterized protein (DUF58 family)
MKRRYHLRVPFWIYCGLTLLIALAAMNSGSALLFWVFGVMASSLLLSGVVSGIMMVGLSFRRSNLPHGVAGEPLVVRYAVRNRNRLFPVFNIHFEEREIRGEHGWERLMKPAPAWVMHIGPRETVHGEAVFRPERRGIAVFDELRIWTTFPFGIVRKSITLSSRQQTLIYPRLYALRRQVLESVAPSEGIGTRVTDHSGAGDDYFGLREYRLGDSLRHIAWKRTANRDQLVCIERAQPTPPKIRVLLNLTKPTDALLRSRTEGISARALEERAISLAASIIHAADLAGYEIGLTILGASRPGLPVRRSHWHRNRLMAALAEIDLDAHRRPLPEWRPSDLDSAALVVVHPDRSDPSVVRGEAWHFTARQLPHLIESDEQPDRQMAHETAAEAAHAAPAREEAA